MTEMTFADVQSAYMEMREKERKNLAEKLKEILEKKSHDLSVVTGGTAGRGISRYTAGNRIPPYDLRNWKWVEVEHKSCSTNPSCFFSCVISLNMPDRDPASGNMHALYDRIGFLVSCKTPRRFYKTEIYTDISLPLDDGHIHEIGGLIAAQYDFWCKETK